MEISIKKHSLLAILTLFVCCFCSAKNVDSYLGKKIHYVRVESAYKIDHDFIHQAIDIHKDDILNEDMIQTTIRNLSLLKRYRQIVLTADEFLDGIMITIRITPEWITRHIKFKGKQTGFLFAYGLESRISMKEILREMVLRENEIFTSSKLNKSIDNLEELYLSYGFGLCQITSEIIPIRDTKEVDVLLKINKGEPTRIKNITFNGNANISNRRLLSKIKLKIGRRFNKNILESDQERLRNFYMKKDYIFTHVRKPQFTYDNKGNTVNVIYSLNEGDRAKLELSTSYHWWNLKWYLYKFENKPQTILEVLGIENTDIIDTDILRKAKTNLLNFYKKRGYTKAEIELVVSENSENISIYTYRINEGEIYKIDQIEIEGNQFFDDLQIKSNFFLKSGNTYNIQTLKDDCDSLVLKYKRAGFQDVKIDCREWTEGENSKEVNLNYVINEGKQYIISEIEITGGSFFKHHDLTDFIGIENGDGFFLNDFENSLSKLRSKYYENGFSNHDVKYSIEMIEESNSKVNYKISVDIIERAQSFLHTILLTGNRKTKFKTIHSKITRFVDKPFSTQSILETQNAISGTGLFSTVKTKTIMTQDDPNQKTLLIDVTEQSSTFLEFGPGYNTDIGFNGYLSGYTNNLFGTNRFLGTSIFVSEETEKSQITYREPEFMGYPIQMELRLFRSITNDEGFDLFRYGGRVSWTYRFTDAFRSILEYRLDSDKPINIETDTVIPLDYRNTVKIASLAPGFLYDSRDDPRDPHRGRLWSLRIEFARSVYSSEVDFTKTTFDAVEFFPISENQTLGISLRCGWGQNLPYQENFKLGGIKTIRGWGYENIRGEKPNGIVVPGTDFRGVGGDFMLLGNIELRSPIFWGLHGVIFLDAGNVWSDFEATKFSDLKTDAGIGIRFMTPIGPVGVDYAYNINRNDDDPRDRWSFVIGHTF